MLDNKIMEHETSYTNMVRSLAKSGQAIIDELTPTKAHLWHMASALLGETIELKEALINNPENWIEEVGDCCFYLEGIGLGLGFDVFKRYANVMAVKEHSLLGDISEHLRERGRDLAIIHASALFDIVKKHVLYGKELDYTALITEAVNVYLFLTIAIHHLDYQQHTLTTCREANMKKLAKRYEGFEYTNKAAQARADKQAGE